MTKEEYNKEPVYFCANCLNLNIKELKDVHLDICQECGNTDIKHSTIEEWNRLYVREYGRAFLEEDFSSIEE